MIYVKNSSTSNIYVKNTRTSAVYIKNYKTWPAGDEGEYYWVLSNPVPSYSEGSNLWASGTNYVTFTCRWEKYAVGGSGIPVESTTVTATPTAPTGFVVSGNDLYFNYFNYRGTTVSSGSKTVTLTHSGETCTGTFSFQGNTSHVEASISPIVPSSNSFTAEGGTGSYSGGVVTLSTVWTSQYVSDTSTSDALFTGYNASANNSSDSDFTGYIDSNKTFVIPNLGTTPVSAGTYTFTSNSYGDNNASVSFVINQGRNKVESSTHDYQVWNTVTDTVITNNDLSITNAAQTLNVVLKDAWSEVWTSTTPSTGVRTYNTNEYVLTHESFSGGDSITSITTSSGHYVIAIAANPDASNRIFGVYFSNTSQQLLTTLAITQAATEVTYYYTLANPSVTYSSGSQLLASGNNYCTFTCDYQRRNSTTHAVVSTQTVTAVPTAPTHFVADGNSLSYDFDNYKGTAVASGNVGITLSHQGIDITTSFAFEGNSSRVTATPVTISNQPVSAGGSTLSFTGGYTTTTWTSGYTENPVYLTFDQAENSAVQGLTANVVNQSNVQLVSIPSLENNFVSNTSSYTFTSTTNNVTFTVYQSLNSSHTSYTYALWDTDANVKYEDGDVMTLPSSPSGTFRFVIKYAYTTTFDSGYSSSGQEITLSASSYETPTYENYLGQCISGIMQLGSTDEYRVSYNSTTSRTASVINIVGINTAHSFNLYIPVEQAP